MSGIARSSGKNLVGLHDLSFRYSGHCCFEYMYILAQLMHLSSASPGGGGPRADVGKYGNFMGTLQQISALVVGEMWGL